MGIVDTFNNKMKKASNKRDEESKINDIKHRIEAENSIIEEQVALIGRFMWNKYLAGEYKPCDEDIEYYKRIEVCKENNKLFELQIEDCRIESEMNVERIDQETNEIIEAKRKAAEERRQAREEARLQRKAEKEAREAAKAQEASYEEPKQ